MFLHLRAVVNSMYAKSENELRMGATSATAGRYETFYITCPGGIRDGAVVEIRAVADCAFLGLDAEGYLGSGRAPRLQLTVQKVGGKPGPAVEDGDTIALHKSGPSWLPWQKYVKVTEGGALRLTKGSRDKEAEFVFVKAREMDRITIPAKGGGQATVALKDLVAPVGGVPIEMESSHPEIVDVQKNVLVPEGRQETTFDILWRSPVGTTQVVITGSEVALPDSVCHAPVPAEPASPAHA